MYMSCMFTRENLGRRLLQDYNSWVDMTLYHKCGPNMLLPLMWICLLAGEIIDDGGFTLSRPFKRLKPRSGSNAAPERDDHAPNSAPSQSDSHMMQPLATHTTRQRSDTKDSVSSTDI